MSDAVLVPNAGSSSLKFSALAAGGDAGVLAELEASVPLTPLHQPHNLAAVKVVTRPHHFVPVSDAFVVTPGGIGTVLETLMVWQLLQVRHLRDTPLFVAGHFRDGLLDRAKAVMLEPDIPPVSPDDLNIPQVLPDGRSVVTAVREHHARWKARQG